MACENGQTFHRGAHVKRNLGIRRLSHFFHLPYPNQSAGGNFFIVTSVKVRYAPPNSISFEFRVRAVLLSVYYDAGQNWC